MSAPLSPRACITRWVAVVCLVVYLAGLGGLAVFAQHMVVRVTSGEVERTVEDFLQFTSSAADPVTGHYYSDAHSLLEAFLTLQEPDTSLALGAAVNGNLIEIANTPRPLAAERPLVAEVLATENASGVHSDPDYGPVPWSTVTVTSADGSDATLIVAHFTDEARDYARTYMANLALIGAGLLGVVVVAAWLSSPTVVRRLQTASADSHDETTHDGDVSGAVIRRLAAELRTTTDDPADLAPAVELLSELIPLPDAAPAMPSELTHFVVRARNAVDRIVPGSVRVTTSGLDDDRDVLWYSNHVITALEIAALTMLERIDGRVELIVDASDNSVSISLADYGYVLSPEIIRGMFDWRVTPRTHALAYTVIRAVADAHHGRAWATSTPLHGTRLGLTLPIEPQYSQSNSRRVVPTGPR